MLEREELEAKYAALDRVIDRYHCDKDQLIRVLQEAQEVFGYLPEEVQTYVAGKMDLPVSEVNGVVTFYSLFATEPQGRFSINVCTGTACYVQGAQNLLEDFKRSLNLTDNDTTPDGLFTVKSTRCIGACGLAPVLTVNDEVHGKLTRKDVAKLLRTYKRKGDTPSNEIKEVTKECPQPRRVKDIDQVPAGLGTDQEQPPAGH
ncbi:MAG TPA: NAD(P)H-dependent oxidoreductase subunit E [Desulfotomaculum sp.]|nr:NAD(P)H-dependent oxidoreductase subunit E [Desulfotomaculum sp.]